MEKHVKHIALLRRMFSEQEWRFLLAHDPFSLALRSAGNSLDDVEKLSILGEQIIQSSRIPCEKPSTDPAKHGGPFKTLSIREVESGIISNEECISCGGTVRRVIFPKEPKATSVDATGNASSALAK